MLKELYCGYFPPSLNTYANPKIRRFIPPLQA